MKSEKLNQIKTLSEEIKSYKKNFITFQKNNFVPSEKDILETTQHCYNLYRIEYITGNQKSFYYSERFEPLKKYLGESEILEMEIKKYWEKSSVYSDIMDLRHQLSTLLHSMSKSGLNGLKPTEQGLFEYKELDIISLNEIKDIYPEFTEYIINEYIPKMKYFSEMIGLTISGVREDVPFVAEDRFILLINDLIGKNYVEKDDYRLRINQIFEKINTNL